MRRLSALSLCAALIAVAPQAASAEEWRIATLAPTGSTWMKLLDKAAQITEKATDGRVKYKYFAGGLQGNDRDVVRKMKLGGLDGAVLTSSGLTMIDKSIHVLQLPRMFRNTDELDYVRKHMWKHFQTKFEKKGYILGEPGDIGWVYFMSKTKITTLAELKAVKVWRWQGDEVSRVMFAKIGLNGVPLGIPDVLPSLMSGRIEACFGSPLAAVALQWTSRIRYMTDDPTTFGIGASVVRKDVWDRLSADDQKKLKRIARKVGKKLRRKVRGGDQEAYRAILRRGVKVMKTPKELTDKLDELAEGAWHELAGKLYSKRELEMVIEYRDAYRAKAAK